MAKKKILSKEQLEEINDCYINKLWNRDQICNYFGFSPTFFKKLIKENLVQKKNNDQIQATMKKTTEERYGESTYRNSDLAKKTCLEKYGDENYRNGESISQTKIEQFKDIDIKEEYINKVKQTKLERYGDCNYTNIEQANKTKQLKALEDDNYKKSIQDKSKQTRLDRYGDENYNNKEQISAKLQEKYSIPEVKEEVLNKIKKTKMENYGNENYNNVIKRKQTLKKRYDDENYFNRKKSINNSLLVNGTKYFSQKDINHYDIWENQDKFVEYLKDNSNQTYIELATFFNVDRTTINQRVVDNNLQEYVKYSAGMSHYEYDIKEFLIQECNIIDLDIIMHEKDAIKPLEIDIYIPSRKMGIEFNGDYWHCDIQEKFQDHNGRSTTHQKKSLKAEEKGIFLFQIFEYERNNPVEQQNIKNRLKTLFLQNTQKIGARKCILQEISKKQKKDFLNENHIQGNDHSNRQYGLFYQNELVACMTFVKPKNKKYTWELSRFCNKHNCTIQGGASKLFTHFVSLLQQGDTISSYNDITKTKGDIYKTLGFDCVSINNPNYVWMNLNTGDIRSRYQEQEAGEVERMHLQGYHRICDCGTKTWVYTVK